MYLLKVCFVMAFWFCEGFGGAFLFCFGFFFFFPFNASSSLGPKVKSCPLRRSTALFLRDCRTIVQ